MFIRFMHVVAEHVLLGQWEPNGDAGTSPCAAILFYYTVSSFGFEEDLDVAGQLSKFALRS